MKRRASLILLASLLVALPLPVAGHLSPVPGWPEGAGGQGAKPAFPVSAARQSLVLTPQRFFYRSDQYSYAQKGIPVVFFFTGEHADRHQPSDEVSKIDFAKFEKIARTIYVTMWEIGEMKTRPKVDKPLTSLPSSSSRCDRRT